MAVLCCACVVCLLGAFGFVRYVVWYILLFGLQWVLVGFALVNSVVCIVVDYVWIVVSFRFAGCLVGVIWCFVAGALVLVGLFDFDCLLVCYVGSDDLFACFD